jgi:BioD-like phosphotransacetylase family protein
MTSAGNVPPQQAVRFSSVNQEIDPVTSLQQDQYTITSSVDQPKEDLSTKDQEAIRSLPVTLPQSRCQARRMENFSFEPVSLPASRVSNL